VLGIVGLAPTAVTPSIAITVGIQTSARLEGNNQGKTGTDVSMLVARRTVAPAPTAVTVCTVTSVLEAIIAMSFSDYSNVLIVSNMIIQS